LIHRRIRTIGALFGKLFLMDHEADNQPRREQQANRRAHENQRDHHNRPNNFHIPQRPFRIAGIMQLAAKHPLKAGRFIRLVNPRRDINPAFQNPMITAVIAQVFMWRHCLLATWAGVWQFIVLIKVFVLRQLRRPLCGGHGSSAGSLR